MTADARPPSSTRSSTPRPVAAHHDARTLPIGDRITFPRLQQLLDMTAGNLTTHLRRLEDAGYVEITKTYRGRSPVTYVALAAAGRRAYEDYLAALHALLQAAAPTGSEPTAGQHRADTTAARGGTSP
jgi:DNA-binding transcriptional ArsR family regulator